MESFNISIIGYGLVGKATHNSLEGHRVFPYDPPKGLKDLSGVLKSDACFICVPTPNDESGQNVGLIRECVDKLRGDKGGIYSGLVIIKSTITPRNMRRLLEDFPELDIMHAPEFLNSYEPYYAHAKHLIGVTSIHQANVYRAIFGLEGYGHADIRTTDPVTAAMCKFVHNLHGVLKVSFFHEMYEICEIENINYREMIGAVLSVNDNVGPMYTKVCADGKKGYGGSCFPVNTKALLGDYDVKTIRACEEANKKWRP